MTVVDNVATYEAPEITNEQVAVELHDFKKLLRLLGVKNLHEKHTYYTGNLASDRGSRSEGTYNAIVDSKGRAALALYDNGYAILSQKRLGIGKYNYYIIVNAEPTKERMRKTAYEKLLRASAKAAQLKELSDEYETEISA